MDRVPIKAQKESLVVLGVDPGLASVGLSIVEYSDGKYEILDSQLITTKKNDSKLCTNLRACVNDQRRYREIYDQLSKFAEPYPLSAVSVEAYTVSVWGKRGGSGGSAWKAAVVYGGVCFWAFCHGIYVAPFLPVDVKSRFCKTKGASKNDVETALREEVKGFSAVIDSYLKTKREHVSDATGHAVLLLEEINRNRVMFSI